MRLLLPKRNSERFSGFTLIEVLVVATVIGLLTGVGIASYNRFNEKQRVQQAAMTFATELRVAQKRANAGEKPVGCLGDLEFYAITTTNSSNTYTLSTNCPGTETKNLGSHAVFGNDQTFTILILNKGFQSDASVTIQGLDGSNPVTISAETGGVITVVP
jgi:type II secretion system protein H